MYRSILVPLDGSSFGEQALPWALSIARRSGASLRLVHVLSPVPAALPEGVAVPLLSDRLEEESRRQRRTYLDAIVARLTDCCPLFVSADLVEGAVAPTIRAAATGTSVDLVVMTTHGRGAVQRFWMGSVADEVIRDLPTPLLLIRPQEQPLTLDSDPVMRHLLLPLDGTGLAEQIIDRAVTLGELTDAHYTLLRVIRPILPDISVHHPLEGESVGEQAESLAGRVAGLQADLREQAQAYLEKVAQPLRARSLTVATRVEVAEQPAEAILREAVPPMIDGVAMETHGRRGLSRLILGSVADKVVRGAQVPILLHRPMS